MTEAIENLRFNDEETEPEPLSESDDEPIILEPIDSGESGVIMAQPLVNVAPSTAIMASLSLIGAPSSSAITASSSENEASTSSRKRKQSSITDFFAKKSHQ